jgi:GAF domain-containing protein
VSDEAARDILVRGAHALARADSLESTLTTVLDVLAERLDVESAVIVVPEAPDRFAIRASVGLEDPAVAGLTRALRDPGHPIPRTMADPVPSFDVLPSVPAGPALRSHLPLTVNQDGTDTVVGVLALAHHRPLDADARGLLSAVADLAAVALDGRRTNGASGGESNQP